ncbi:TetR/AcrR family transcriptional regulator [Clostridium sp. D2Q-11]|uniref:TetR/AcrR family transcriptional regulator n=1 Tax=Anaeromonas frigoriresistens TaxID=2683708 RepID=A0A942UQF4_9FIRM|nr:TetR/AcrR family transcriptional regulator [Anaeromonas frigoriresistens]MBS4537389.1 TetR/AcrR family transcriptional regulator [Anaeromonas frigoriresistens]
MITKKGEETRNQILEASEQLFMEKSVSKVTINDIVQRAGIAKGTFYLYFDSKEALVWHFIDTKLSGLNKYLAKLDVEGYEKEDIERIISYIVFFLKKHNTLLKLMHHVRFFTFIGFHNMESKSVNKWIEWLTVWIEKGRLKGELYIDNSNFMAYFLVITIHEVLERAIIEETPFTIDEASEELKALVVKLLK